MPRYLKVFTDLVGLGNSGMSREEIFGQTARDDFSRTSEKPFISTDEVSARFIDPGESIYSLSPEELLILKEEEIET